MAKHLFTSLIKCSLCDYNFRYIKDREISKYICSSYSRQIENGCTERYSITEKELIYLIQIFCNRNHIEMEYTNEFMKSIIDKIYVDGENHSLIVKYRNGEEGIYSIKEVQI